MKNAIADSKTHMLRDKIFNFTDSIYYIEDSDLMEWAAYMDYGVIGCGTAHILADDNDGYIRCGSNVLGKVYHDTSRTYMAMQVKGNDQTYTHRVVFPDLLKYDAHKIGEAKDEDGNAYKVLVIAKDRFDFGATIYTRFVIVKAYMNQRMVTPPTLFQRTCVNRNESAVNCGVLYDKEGKEYTVDFSVGKNGVFHSKDGKSDIVYTTVNSHIIAARVPKLTVKRENWCDKVWNILDDFQNAFSYYHLNEQSASFAIPTSVYNDIVKQIIKADTIDRKTILEIVLLGNLRCPNADMIEVLLPLINSALKDAAMLETRVQTILKDQAAHLVNGFKQGTIEVNRHESVMFKFTRAFVGNSDGDMEQEMAHALDLGF